MASILRVEQTVGGNSHQIGRFWTHDSSSMTSSEAKSYNLSPVIQAGKPSKYLRRRGPIPNGIALKIDTRYKTSSSSSSTVTSPSSRPSNSNNTGYNRSSDGHLITPSLPSLTESNLTRFMEQLNLSSPQHLKRYFHHPTRAPAVEISYFSDGSSTHSGSDLEWSKSFAIRHPTLNVPLTGSPIFHTLRFSFPFAAYYIYILAIFLRLCVGVF